MKVSKYYIEETNPEGAFCASGNGFNPHYRLDERTGEVIQDGEDNLQEMIDAAADSVNIQRILARYAQTNDPALLMQRSAMFGDLTAAPGTIQEAHMLLRQAKDTFDSLDESERNGFASFEAFCDSYDMKEISG